MDFLFVSGTHYDLILRVSTLEELQTCIDLGQNHLELTVGSETIWVSLEMFDDRKEVGSATDGEDFTSDSGPSQKTRLIPMKNVS